MRSLFVMDPVWGIDLQTDSTWMLMRECWRRGWPVSWCEARDLFLEEGRVLARAQDLLLQDQAPGHRSLEPRQLPLADCDLVWMRRDPPYDLGYLFTTYLLDLAARHTTVINDPVALKLANEKLYALRWPEHCPDTVISSDLAHVRLTVERMGRAVLKPWDGCGGRGVVLTGRGDPNLNALAELLTEQGQRAILVQRYLPGIAQGDKRIILVDGEPRGWLNRVPGEQDHRGNMHVGARAEPCELDDRDRAICAAVGPELKRRGMVFVGLDVIDGRLTEINVTSPTGIQEANRFMGVRLEEEIVDAALSRARHFHGGTP